MDTHKLVALHFCNTKDRCIEFHYREQRWDKVESLRPWDIREAFKICLEKIEEAVPGALERAAIMDDEEWMMNKVRTRRYIAESQDLLYINKPKLRSQSEMIAGYYVLTNIPWRDVPDILRLVCKAAGIEYREYRLILNKNSDRVACRLTQFDVLDVLGNDETGNCARV